MSQVHFGISFRLLQVNRRATLREKVREMDAGRYNQDFKGKGETFSTFNKNIFSFEALEV